MLAMIVFMLLAILSMLARDIFILIATKSKDDDDFYKEHNVIFAFIWNWVSFMLSIACTLNARNWIHFYI